MLTRSLLLLVASLLCLALPLQAATITQLKGYEEVGPAILNDFETRVNIVAGSFSFLTFSDGAKLVRAAGIAKGETPSGSLGLRLNRKTAGDVLVASLGLSAYAVGLTFGNDSFSKSADVSLSIYDGKDAHLGTFSVKTNGNGFADQFIGLRSDTPFAKVELRYGAGSSLFAFYIDDFVFSTIPEPGTGALLAFGMLSFALLRRKR